MKPTNRGYISTIYSILLSNYNNKINVVTLNILEAKREYKNRKKKYNGFTKMSFSASGKKGVHGWLNQLSLWLWLRS